LYKEALKDLARYIEKSANAIHDAYPDAKVIAPSFHMDDLAFWIKAVDKAGNVGKVGFFCYPDGTNWSTPEKPVTKDEHRRKYWHHLLSLNTDGDSLLLGEEIDVIGAHYGDVWEWRRTKAICDKWYNDSAGITPKPFWVMETGGDSVFANNWSEEIEQATYYRDTFIQWLDAVDANEFDPKEDKVFVFTLWHYDPPNYGGLLYRDTLKPKIAYYTMRDFTYGSVDYYTDVDTSLTKPSIDLLVPRTNGIIEMCWRDSSADNTHFQIYWDDFITVNETGSSILDQECHRVGSCTAGDLPLPSGKRIGLRMRAFKDSGEIYVSPWTDWVHRTVLCQIHMRDAQVHDDPLRIDVHWTDLSLSVSSISTVKLEWIISSDGWTIFGSTSPSDSANIASHYDTSYTLENPQENKWYTFRLLVISHDGDSVYSDQCMAYTSTYGQPSGHHASGTFEVPWRYDLVPPGPFDLRDLIAEAVNGSQGWNGVAAGIKFTESGSATYTWKWGDLDHPTDWARTVVVPFDPIDTLRIGSIETTLNRNIQASDSTPLYWYNKNTATDSISSNEVDAYSVIRHEWGHWYVLMDASNITDTSFVTFPHHVAGRMKRELTAGDVNDARWMYSDTAAVEDTTAPNYNGDWVENPGGSLITETTPQTGFFDWMSWKKWSNLYTSTSELANLGRRVHDEMAIDGSIVKLASDHKIELLCWAVVRPGLFTEALDIVLTHKDSLLPAAQDTTIPLESAGMVVDSAGAQEILGLLEEVKNLPFTWLTGLRNDMQRTIEFMTPLLMDNRKMGELLKIAAEDSLPGTDHGGADWTWTADSTREVSGVHYDIGAFTIESDAIMNVKPYDENDMTGRISISARTMSIQGTLSADSAGYEASEGPGQGTDGSSYYGAGGGAYGARGGHGGWGLPGDTVQSGGYAYSDSAHPDEMGSGGGSVPYFEGGRGGGIIKLVSSGTTVINGKVSSDGDCGTGSGEKAAGGGAGGSIWLETSLLSGGGLVCAKGGEGFDGSCADGGGGSGGRIRVIYSNSSFDGRIEVSGGIGPNHAVDGQCGTALVQHAGNSVSLLISPVHAGTNPDSKEGFIKGVEFADGWIRLSANDSIVGNTYVSASDSIVLHSGSYVLTDKKGNAHKEGTGRGHHGTIVTIPKGGGGAGYGGIGGHGRFYVPGGLGDGGIVYGDSIHPNNLGSGGGDWDSTSGHAWGGGSGGGRITLKCFDGDVLIDGTLSANGGNGNSKSSWAGGGGSGGSISVYAGSLAGAGTINAKGGNGATSSFISHGGGGAGGRVSLHRDNHTFSGSVSVAGGLKGGSGATDGVGGTIYTGP
jgi:hypothetical protein